MWAHHPKHCTPHKHSKKVTAGGCTNPWGDKFFYAKAKSILRGWPDTPFMAARCLEEGAGKNRS